MLSGKPCLEMKFKQEKLQKEQANNCCFEDNHLYTPGTWQWGSKGANRREMQIGRVYSSNQAIFCWSLQRIKSHSFNMECKTFQDCCPLVCSISFFPHTFSSSWNTLFLFTYYRSLLNITSFLMAFLPSAIPTHQILFFLCIPIVPCLRFRYSISKLWVYMQSLLIYSQFHIQQFSYLLKCICNLQINTCEPFMVTCGYIHRSKKFEPLIVNVPS